MRKRKAVGLAAALLLGITAILVIPSTRQSVLSWVSGEPYYRGRSASHWSKVTNDTGNPVGQAEAKRRLIEGGADAVPALLWIIASRMGRGDLDEWVREIGEPAIPALREALRRGRPMTGENYPSVPAGKSPDDSNLRLAAVDLLGDFGDQGTLALREALDSRYVEVRSRAARILVLKLHYKGADVVQALRALLRERGAPSWVRENAAIDLGEIGPDASEAAKDLTTALNDTDELVREAARKALGRVSAGPQK